MEVVYSQLGQHAYGVRVDGKKAGILILDTRLGKGIERVWRYHNVAVDMRLGKSLPGAMRRLEAYLTND